MNVTDVNGSAVTLTGTATVTDLPVSGAVRAFSATEGRSTGTIVLGTFTDPNPLATVADVTATLPIGGWGDGTPTAVQTLAVQQIGATPAGTIFEVLGAHTYADTGSFTVNINVSTLDSGPTALTPGTATVVDATLTGSTGITFKGIEGIATPATTLIGTFTDADPSATVADFTTGTGSVVVNWGDGSAPQTLTAANLTANNSVDNTVFSIDASHTYSDEGAYAVTIAVTDTDGATTIVSSTAIIADAALTPVNPQPTVTQVEPTIFPVPQFGAPAFTGRWLTSPTRPAHRVSRRLHGDDRLGRRHTAVGRHDRRRPDGQSGRHVYRLRARIPTPKWGRIPSRSSSSIPVVPG